MKEGVSIIVCTNGKRMEALEKCLHSLKSQSLENLEIICVTTTNLPMHIKNLIDMTLIEKRKGVSIAKNKGIVRCKHNHIALTDDDCFCSKTWAENLLKNFTSDSIAVVTGRTLPGNDECTVSTIDATERKIFKYNKKYIPHYLMGNGNNICFRKEVLQKIGLFDERFGPGARYAAAEDAEIIHRILKNGYEIIYSPDAVVYHDCIEKSLANVFYLYGVGFGAFCRKYNLDIGVKRYFLSLNYRILLDIPMFIIKGDFSSVWINISLILGLIKGYFIYHDELEIND